MFFDDGFLVVLIILAMVVAPLVFLAKIVFFAFVVKKAIDAYRAQQEAVHEHVTEIEALAAQSGASAQWRGLLRAAHQMQTAVDRRAEQRSAAPTGAVSTQFMTAWSKAQMELNQFDRLSRERADMHLAGVKSEAASMGLFL